MTITPDGRTVYVASKGPAEVIPITTASDTPGKAIELIAR